MTIRRAKTQDEKFNLREKESRNGSSAHSCLLEANKSPLHGSYSVLGLQV